MTNTHMQTHRVTQTVTEQPAVAMHRRCSVTDRSYARKQRVLQHTRPRINLGGLRPSPCTGHACIRLRMPPLLFLVPGMHFTLTALHSDRMTVCGKSPRVNTGVCLMVHGDTHRDMMCCVQSRGALIDHGSKSSRLNDSGSWLADSPPPTNENAAGPLPAGKAEPLLHLHLSHAHVGGGHQHR